MDKNWATFTLIILILTQLPSFTAVRSRLNIDHNNSKKQNSKKHIALLAKNCRLVKGDANFVVCVAGELKKDQVFGREKAHLLKERSRKLIQKFKNSNRRFIKPEIEKKTPNNKGLRKISLEVEFCDLIPGNPHTFVCAIGSSKQARASKEVLSQVKQTARTLHKNYKPKKPNQNSSRNLFTLNASSTNESYSDSCQENFGMSCQDCYWWYGMSCEDYHNLMNDPCYWWYGMSCEDYENMMNDTCSYDTCTYDTCSYDTCTYDTCSYDTCTYDTCSYDTCTYDTCSYDTCTYDTCSYDTCTYDTCSYDTCTYDTCSYDTCTYDTCSYDTCTYDTCSYDQPCTGYGTFNSATGIYSYCD
jgi:hypothetical protein